MRLSSPVPGQRAGTPFVALACLTALLGACSTSSGPGSITTESLPPRPAEGMVQQPHSRYTPPSTIGGPPPSTASHYQWNGNRDRAQAGASPADVSWKATPRATAVNTRGPATGFETASAGDIIVGPGDTLYGLASRHHVSVASLMQVNNLQGPAIAVNQRLKLPAAR